MSIGNIDWSGLAAGKGLARGMSVGSQLAQNIRNAELQRANIGMAERKEQRDIEAAQMKRSRQQSALKEFKAAAGDPAKMLEFAVKYPELKQQASDAFGFANDATKQGVKAMAASLLSVDDPQKAASIIESSLPGLIANGATPTNLNTSISRLRSDNSNEALQELSSIKDMTTLLYSDVGKSYLDMQKQNSEMNKKDLDAEVKSLKNTFDQASKLRSEYYNQSKDFMKVSDAYARIKASIDEPDAAGDLSLIFNFMKMLDPGSTVREGEFATAQNSGGIDTAIVNIYNKAREGTRLTPQQRKMFSNRANKLFSAAERGNKKIKKDILSIAKNYKLSEQDLFGANQSPVPVDDINSLVDMYAD